MKESENENYRGSFARRLALRITILLAVVGLIVSLIAYNAIKNTYMRLYNEMAQSLVGTLAGQIDGNRIENYVQTGEKDEYYEQMQQLLNKTKDNFKGIQYLYIYYPVSNGFIYVVDGMAQTDRPEDINALGDFYEFTPTDYENLVPDIQAGRASEKMILGEDVGYGQPLSAWAPVFDSSGKLAAMVDADCIMSELNSVIWHNISNILVFMLLAIIAGGVLILLVLRKTVTIPMDKLIRFVRSYEHGTINEDLNDFKNDDEIRYLADSFQEMTFRIDKYIHDLTAVTAEKERIGAELNVATQIQADMLPRIFPPYPERKEFDLYATMDPAKEVGGDFYDFFLVDDNHLALVMADVSGKGVPAALFMVIAKTMLKNRAQMGGTPGEILRDVNNQLCEGNDAELFVTVWMGILELSTGHLVSASAGHEYPAFYRAEKGRFDLEKDRHGPPLATMEGLRFRETETDMAHGDALFLYTDGVTEATSGALELFGEDRMVAALNDFAAKAPVEILPGVRGKIDAFVGTAPQFDDITMLCVRFN